MKKETHGSLLRDFTTGSVPKQLILFSIPLFLSNFLQVVYNMADMLFVGRYSGSLGLSAVSIGGDVQNFMTFLAMGFSSAGQVIIAQYLGAGQKEKLSRFIGTMFTTLLSASLVLSGICLLLRGTILQWLNTPPEIWNDTMAYATTCMVGLLFIYGYNMVSAVLRGMGDSRHPFLFIGMAAIMNIFLDFLLVAVFSLGAFGAALATVISQGTSFLAALIFLYRRRASLGFSLCRRDFLIDPHMLASLAKLGLPMALSSAAVQFSKLFVNRWVNDYGVDVVAVAGIGHKFGTISNLFASSLNAAGASMVGQNIGAERYDRVLRIVRVLFLFNTCISALLSILMVTIPTQLFGLFTDEPAVLVIAMEFIPAAVLNFVGCACRSSMGAFINGSGNPLVNASTALFDGIIMRIGLAILLGFALHLGYVGFWLGDSLAGFTPAIIGIVYMASGRWKTKRHVIKQ